jgi:cyclic beta-1,2-glucan synthetase
VDPCLPTSWPSCTVTWRQGRTVFEITIENPAGRSRGVGLVELDGEAVDPSAIPWRDDRARHRLRVVLGPVDELVSPRSQGVAAS